MESFKLSLKTKTGYEELNGGELSRFARNFAFHLIDKVGLKYNDRVAILSESRPEFAIGVFASIQIGAIIIPLDLKCTLNELTTILSDCNPKALLCSSRCIEKAAQLKESVKSIEEIFVLEKLYYQGAKKIPTYRRSQDDIALIVYTSGTTSSPKGVMISYGNLRSQIRDFKSVFKIKKGSTAVSVLPLNHLLELCVGFFGALYIGVKIVYIETLKEKELLSAMKEKQVTNMLIVPSVAKMLKAGIEKEIKKKLWPVYKISKYLPHKIRRLVFKPVIDRFGGKLDYFICGGAPLSFEIEEFFERIGIPIYQGYGLTETSPVISTNYPGQNKMGTVGKPFPSVKVKIAHNGEILVKGSNVMQGYWGELQAAIDEDGWLHTGDIGEIDKDGYLSITGRLKNIIALNSGKKVSPEEVEAVLEKSLLIKEVCALPLKIKMGKKYGEEGLGVVAVPVDDLAKNTDDEIQEILDREIKTLSMQNLACYKRPAAVIISKQPLPKTSTNKMKRKEIFNYYNSL